MPQRVCRVDFAERLRCLLPPPPRPLFAIDAVSRPPLLLLFTAPFISSPTQIIYAMSYAAAAVAHRQMLRAKAR